jgi:hypothetical protein
MISPFESSLYNHTFGEGSKGSSFYCIKSAREIELLITIMSSLAQEESRSISENVTWG